MSPTQRTLAALRKAGWTAEVVERWLPNPRSPIGGVRKDLFGFGDVAAVRERGGTLLVQATSTPNVSARVAKMLALPTLAVWLRASPHNHVEVWGWAKRGARGKRKVYRCERRAAVLNSAGVVVVVPVVWANPKDFPKETMIRMTEVSPVDGDAVVAWLRSGGPAPANW